MKRMKLTLAAATLSAALLITACGSPAQPGNSPGPVGSTTSATTDPAVAKLVPSAWAHKPVKVAVFNNMPPHSYVDGGHMIGWVPDFTKVLGEVTGLNFQVEEVSSFDVIAPGLQSGRFDLAPDTFYITPERLKNLDLITMSKEGTSFGVKAGSNIVINRPEDLCGRTVGALAGSAAPDIVGKISQDCVKTGAAAITVNTYPNNTAGATATVNGRTDVYAATTGVISYIGKQMEGKFTAQPLIHNQRLEALALPKGSELAPVVQAGINSMIKSGTYGEILNKWGLKDMAIQSSEVNPAN